MTAPTTLLSSRSVTALYLLLALLMLPACMLKRRYVVMQELQPGGAALGEGAEVVGEVQGYANFKQVFTLFSTGSHRGTRGTLLAPEMRGLLEARNEIPVLDPLVRRLVSLVMGTTHLEATKRVALGRAIEHAEEMGADAIVAPRFEIETSSFTFFVPLGFLHSTGEVWVKAKAVRLAGAESSDPGDSSGADGGDSGRP